MLDAAPAGQQCPLRPQRAEGLLCDLWIHNPWIIKIKQMLLLLVNNAPSGHSAQVIYNTNKTDAAPAGQQCPLRPQRLEGLLCDPQIHNPYKMCNINKTAAAPAG